MSTPESQDTPDFSEALDRQDRIIATERFLYDGDPRAVGIEGLAHKIELRRQPPDGVDSDSRVVDIIGPYTGLKPGKLKGEDSKNSSVNPKHAYELK